jgi:ATPase subunit of ABC transporter with duplicated ATPase domains
MPSKFAVSAKSAGPAVVLSDLSFSWPNGRRVLSHLSATFAPGRTGLIGVNGAGKSTLLRLIADQLRPSSGSVRVTGDVGYLPQNLTLDTGARVASLLGLADVLDAIEAIEAGDVSPAAFDAVGDDWDAEDRAREWLSRLGLAHVGLDDPVGRLSGGETIMTALTGLFLRRPAVMLLDEPTNNLDLAARRRLYTAVESWPGVMLIVSHDRELLGLTDQIADLRSDHYGDSLRLYGGNLADTGALAGLIVRGPERIALTGPNGSGKTTLLRIIAGQLVRRDLDGAGLDGPCLDKPGPARPGPARPDLDEPGLAVVRNGPLGYLPQRLDVLDDALTVAENVRAPAPAASVNDVISTTRSQRCWKEAK